MSLRELYQEIIVDHGKNPRHTGQLEHANHCQAGHNPLCGDKLMLYVIEKDDVVVDLRFEGNGCAISMASASLMCESVKGKTLSVIEKLFTAFHHVVTTGEDDATDLGKLAVFAGVAAFPVRVKCATLAWHTLNAALADESKPATTE